MVLEVRIITAQCTRRAKEILVGVISPQQADKVELQLLIIQESVWYMLMIHI